MKKVRCLSYLISNPYQVSTPEQLNAVRNDLSAHYIQINDIDMSNWGSWEPIGNAISNWGGAIGGSNYHEPTYTDNYFTGVYDGNNHKIVGLNIENNTVSVTKDCFGMFAGLKKGIVKNLVLSNISYDIDKATTDYSSYWENQLCTFSLAVGSIVGRCDNSSSISNCYVDGKINVINCSNAYVGGISDIGNTISNCNSNIEIYVNANKDSRSEKDSSVYCGGIAGGTRAVNSKMSYCTNEGNINIEAGNFAYCGGVSGKDGYIEKCINYGNITGNVLNKSAYSGFAGISNVGGIVGATSSDSVSNCINYGNIISCAKTNNHTGNLTSYAGGIVGFCGYYSSGNINNCYNYNDTIVSQTKDKDDNLLIGDAGRIAGYSIKTSDCYSVNTTTVNGIIPTENISKNKINGGSLTKEEMAEKIKDLI